jgi:hypothetical protein
MASCATAIDPAMAGDFVARLNPRSIVAQDGILRRSN